MKIGRTTFDTSTPAVVLKLRPAVMHHGELGAIRSLGRMGVPVYGVHSRKSDPAANSRYLRGGLVWRPDAEQVERTHAGLRRLAELIGRPSVLIPTDDASAIFLAEQGTPLREWFVFSEPPADLPRRVADKHSLYRLCRELDVPAPRTSLPSSPVQARQFAAKVGYPLIAKLTTAWRVSSPKLRSTSIIVSRRELDDLQHACELDGSRLMLQELIPRSPECDWFFHGYCDADSVCRPGFTGVKDRSFPAHAGVTCLGHAVRNDHLHERVTTLLACLSYRGIVDLDFRRDAQTGQYMLLDFNPRLGAQFRLFRDRSGLDVALAAYLDLTGQEITVGEQIDGRGFLVENLDPPSALEYWRSGELTLKSWLASLRRADEMAWFALDDLRPFALMCARVGFQAIRRRFTYHAQAASTTRKSQLTGTGIVER